MKILVTGSSGRVGTQLVSDLVRAGGYEVSGFDRSPPRKIDPGLRYFEGALTDSDALRQACAGVEAVVHLGAFMSWNDAERERLYESNVTGTFRLLEALDRRVIRRFVFISTGEVYPEGRPEYQPIDEQHPTRPLSQYGLTKLLGEQLVAFHARKFGLPTVILRISHTQTAQELLDPSSAMSGPRFYLQAKLARARLLGHASVVALLEPLAGKGEKLVVSRGEDGLVYKMHIADVRDTSAGIRLALESKAADGQTINLGPDQPVSFDAAVQGLARITGLPTVEVILPGPAVHYQTSNDKAKKLLGFAPRWDFFGMLADAAAVGTT